MTKTLAHVLAHSFAGLLVAATAACADAGAHNGDERAQATPAAAAPGATMPFAIEKLTESFEGSVREVLRVSGYTYVAVDTGAGVRWAVSLQKDIDEGAQVRVRAFGKKEAFESKKLGRTFDELWFAIITPVT